MPIRLSGQPLQVCRRCSRSPIGWCGRCGRGTHEMPGMPGSLGFCRYPLAIETNRARIASPRSVWMIQRELRCVPADFTDLGVQAGVAVEVVVFGDAPAVREDLRALGVLLGRDVPDLLEQRQVDVGLDVARDAGIAVPVPGAADVGGLVDQPDVSRTPSSRSRAPVSRPPKPAPMIATSTSSVSGSPGERRAGPRVLGEPGELPGDLDVLRDPVRTQPALALLRVAGAQRVGVERQGCHDDRTINPRRWRSVWSPGIRRTRPDPSRGRCRTACSRRTARPPNTRPRR